MRSPLELFLEMFPRDEVNLIFTVTNTELQKIIFPEIPIWEMIKYLGNQILIICYEFASLRDMWSSRSQ